MLRRTGAILVLALATVSSGCDQPITTPTPAPTPSPATPVPPPTPPGPSGGPAPAPGTLVRFTDPATGFSTADVRDGRDHVVQFDTSGNVIWVADGTRVPGYRAQGSYVPAEGLCACWLEVRFGSVAGERRAYLTADYGHDNPGSLIALDLVDGRLAFARTDLFPPGTYTLSGIVTEMTPTGSVPVAGTQIWRGYGTGWQVGKTDSSGFYEIHGLYNRTDEVSVIDPRFQKFNAVLTISEDTRFDVQLVRVPTSMAAPSR